MAELGFMRVDVFKDIYIGNLYRIEKRPYRRIL